MKGGGGYTQWGEHDVGFPTLLFALLGAALAWTFHFLVVYFVVGLFCTTAWSEATADALIYASTAVFAVVSALSGVVAYRGWKRVRPPVRDLEDAATTAGGPSRLLLLLGVASAVIFTPFIVLEGLAPLFVPICAVTVGGGAP